MTENHQHDYKFVRRYRIGGRYKSQQVEWLLYRCACGKERRTQA